jgi:hypothetical protein
MQRLDRLLTGCALSVLSACTGNLLGDASDPAASEAGGGGGTASAGPIPPGQCAAIAPPLEARLLSPSQYDHTVSDLLGFVSSEATATFGATSSAPRSLAELDELTVERLAGIADRVAVRAVENLATTFTCSANAPADDACVRAWLAELGRRAFRRPLDDLDLAQLQALYAAGAAEGSSASGVEWLMAGVLQSPDFLYRLVLNEPAEAGTVIALRGHELATRLSYFLWDSLPDAALFAAAEAGSLHSDGALDAELTRMLQHPSFERSVQSFYDEWLGLDVFAEVARDHADFGKPVIDSLRASVQTALRVLYAQPAPSADELLGGTRYYMDSVLTSFYGLPPGPPGFSAVDLGSEGRRGIVTHPALMTALARPDQTYPIGRGLFVLESLLCQHLEAPANLLIPPLEPIPEGGTERDQLALHSQGACQGCHARIDPLGFAFQNFDEVGRLRKPALDTSGTVANTGDVAGAFANGTELFERIARSSTVRECFATHYFEYALARRALLEGGQDPATNADACSIAPIRQAFLASGDLKQLLVTIAKSPAFRHRLVEGAP